MKARMRLPISEKLSSCRTASELSQLIVQTEDTLRFSAALWGLRTTYDVHIGLIGKRVVDFLLVLIKVFFRWVLRLRRY